MADQVQVGENALLFEPGDAQALADQIRALLEQPQRLLALCGRGGRPRSIADYGEQLDQLYARLQRR